MSDSDSDSYSSDDDYLTSFGQAGGKSSEKNHDGTEEEREAIIRRKLMESFYGTAAADADAANNNRNEKSSSNEAPSKEQSKSRTKKEDDDDAPPKTSASTPISSQQQKQQQQQQQQPQQQSQQQPAQPDAATDPAAATSDETVKAPKDESFDLNSHSFASHKHTHSLLLNSNTETLLQQNETLALNIRHLDSTMQTLVYENYSKFIDATDAVRSINQSVDHSAEHGLDQLKSSIQNISKLSIHMDQKVFQLRKQVAEKMDIKSHLERLSNLLNLPSSLQTCLSEQKYRLAAKRHAHAAVILAKHSDGFESLIQIENECRIIMEHMLQELILKLMTWSGKAIRQRSSRVRADTIDDDDDDDDCDNEDEKEDKEDSETKDEDLDNSDETKADTDDHPSSMKPEEEISPFAQNVAEIFECAGTFDILSTHQIETLLKPSQAKQFTSEKCKPLALDAVGRMLERNLDLHRIITLNAIESHSNDYNNGDVILGDEKDSFGVGNSHHHHVVDAAVSSWGAARQVLREQLLNSHPTPKLRLVPGVGDILVPTDFLDQILEACTLFAFTFSDSNKSKDSDQLLLNNFVSRLFSTFLSQVRMDLLELSLADENNHNNDHDDTSLTATGAVIPPPPVIVASPTPTQASTQKSDSFTEIATALTHLIRSTRELASGLALPEVGIDMSIASGLVDQTVELTETMIRRYVSLRFYALRTQAVTECLAPFVQEMVASVSTSVSKDSTHKDEKQLQSTSTVADVVRRASVAVAEMMQLADSKIGEVTAILSSAPVESAMVRLSVQKNACRFALWLASTFEVLAGCDTIQMTTGRNDSFPKVLRIKDTDMDDLHGNDADSGNDLNYHNRSNGSANDLADLDDNEDAMSELSFSNNHHSNDDDDSGGQRAEDPLHSLVMQLEDAYVMDPVSGAHMTLALAQVCRMAKNSVIETINSSIGTCMVDHSLNADPNNSIIMDKDLRGRFAHNTTQGVNVDADGKISRRFQLSSMRILSLYATDQGIAAGAFACHDIASDPRSDYDSGDTINFIPKAPRYCVCKVLEIAKASSIDCATIFGGDAMAAPVQPFEDDDDVFHSDYRGSGGLGGTINMAGVQLDVERMFAQKMVIYKDTLEFDRELILTQIFMIAFKAMIERMRACVFTTRGYRQMRVDVEMLRHLVPHYIQSSDYLGSLYNLLDDIMMNARDRCLDKDTVGDGSEFYDDNDRMVLPASILRRFMEEQSDLTARFVIAEES